MYPKKANLSLAAFFPFAPNDWEILAQIPEECLNKIFVGPGAIVPESFDRKSTVVDTGTLSLATRRELRRNPFDALLWFGQLSSLRALCLWLKLFRLAPDTLLIVASEPGLNQDKMFEKGILHLGLWLRVIDFAVLIGGSPDSGRYLSPKRHAVYPFADERKLIDLVAERVAVQRRSVLWVDPHLTTKSPSMRSLVNSVNSLEDHSWNIRGLCYDSLLSDHEVTRLPKLPLPGVFDLLQFFIACNLYRMVQDRLFRRRPATIVHTTCAYDLQAELVSVHFCHRRWFEFSAIAGIRSIREWIGQQFSRVYAWLDRLQLRSANAQMLLPVSRAIGEAVRDAYGVRLPQVLLPNAFDESRFNVAARQRHRVAVRQALGFGDDVSVFAFTSYGHYRRKGFWLIVEALKVLGVSDEIRLLVIGGSEKNLIRLRNDLAKELPAYSRSIVFVGMTNEVEKYLAAADAYLFPSYFEAFCLAEIEAAAMGSPLFVTRHPGTEMIVRPGKNGVFLEADPRDIADKMRRFAAGEFRFEVPDTGEALTREAFAARIGEIYENWLAKKWDGTEAIPPYGTRGLAD
jgi:glycosyltransferase involved in cell wall biosynthesis